MWEAIEHENGVTIFRGADPEGNVCFAWTVDRDGMTVEPSSSFRLYSLSECRRQIRERDLELEYDDLDTERCIDCGSTEISEGQCLRCSALRGE